MQQDTLSMIVQQMGQSHDKVTGTALNALCVEQQTTTIMAPFQIFCRFVP
jgi:hypothetical protein